MYKIIPAILVPSKDEFVRRLREAEPFTDRVQLDILDGEFVSFDAFDNPEEIRTISTKLTFDLHLMVRSPMEEIEKWKDIPQVRRVIFHVESLDDPDEADAIIQKIKSNGWKAGIALNPDTPIEIVEPCFPQVEIVLFMGVEPGRSEQTFLPKTMEKIQLLSERTKKPIIAVDGGVNHDTILPLKEAGVAVFYVGSELFEKHSSVEEAMTELKKLLA